MRTQSINGFFVVALSLLFSMLAHAQLPALKKINLSIPIASNNIGQESGFYLSLYAQRIDKPLDEFFKKNSHKGDKSLFELIASVNSNSFPAYKRLSTGSEKGKTERFKQLSFGQRKGAFKNPNLLYRIYFGDDIIYIIKTFFMQSERAVDFLFSNKNGSYYYESDFRVYPILDVIIGSIGDHEILNLPYIKDQIKADYKKDIVFGEYPVEISYKNQWIVHKPVREFSKVNKVKDAKKEYDPVVKKIGLFYKEIQQQLEANQLDAVFKKMSPKSVERFTGFTGNYTNIDVAELSAYVLNMAVPDTIAMIIDADPFYIIYGTNFTPDYKKIMAMKDKEARAIALKKLELSHKFLLKQNDGTLKLTHLLSNRFIGRLLQDDRFMDQVVIPALVD